LFPTTTQFDVSSFSSESTSSCLRCRRRHDDD
jgi:hypothetical protein